jgi:RNA polymerase sigma factor (TIGR02999 family)
LQSWSSLSGGTFSYPRNPTSTASDRARRGGSRLNDLPAPCPIPAHCPQNTLSPEVYAQLRAIAGRVYSEKGFSHKTIQPTVLLHDAWMKLSASSSNYESRAHFMAVASRAMRQILVDRARLQYAQKRGGPGQRRTTLAGLPGEPDQLVDVLSLNSAIESLKAVNERAAVVVLMRSFGGMTIDEIA